MKSRAIVGCLLSLALGLSAALAQDKAVNQSIDTVLGDHTKYEAVILALQKSVKAHDPASVAALVNYPIGVTIKGKKKTFKAAKDFIASYDAFMTPDITSAVVKQKYADLLVNQQGVAFGAGQVWINGICKDNACKNFDVKVVTIQSGP
jgi:hypothetical protein